MNLISSIHDTKVDRIDIDTQRSQVTSQTNINIELYSAGEFDGLTGLNAELPQIKDYWFGYQLGYREYGTGLLGVEIPATEIQTERLAALMTA